MLIPGDPTVGNLMRSMNTLSDVKNDPRKRQLIDTGNINRDRQLDRNLNAQPNGLLMQP